ncbi:hypothetical protein RJ640_017648 [Escallonia rubra]|uniref:Ribosomal RNA-processing protein 17 n=1 Tax=Escallonia rubra TaxID=112253 RepID=A0AA88R306_9ASTE|nr:hypothetical protein RJ640_017648 [Escallonia rubra]
MAEEGEEEGAGGQLPHIRARHIKKRSLKNKSLSVPFNEKDLKDYVTGFHKRKKKRRKEAQHQLEEVERRKRIERRKKRKLERESVYGEAPSDPGAEPNEIDEDDEPEKENELIASVSGTKMYDNGDVKVMVTTSEISHEEEALSAKQQGAVPRLTGGSENKKSNVPVSKKKQFKRVARKRSRPKPQSKRDKKKGKKKGRDR